MLSPHINVHRPSSDVSEKSEAKKESVGQKAGGRLQIAGNKKTPVNPAHSQGAFQNSVSAPNSPRSSLNAHSATHPQQHDDTIVIQWNEKHLDKVPELSILSKRSAGFHATGGHCLSKFLHLITAMCQAFNRVGDSALANFKPVLSRTVHTLDYVNDLAREYTINLKYGSPNMSIIVRTASGTTVKSDQSKASKSSNTSSSRQRERTEQTIKNQLLKEFYEKSHRTLSILQQCTGYFKTIIYNLTFSRYVEEELTESEVKMTRGKSIVGTCIWVVTLALQQLQEDPEVEQNENFSKSNPDLVLVGVELSSLISLSLQIWHDILVATGILEKVYRRTEDVFHQQTNLFFDIHTKTKPNAEAVHLVEFHTKEYRRPLFYDIEEFKSKTFDPYSSLLTWSHHGKRSHSHGPSRILYLTNYVDPDSLWWGFDTLSVNKKIAYVRDVLNFVKLVLESVKENIYKIITDLNGHVVTRGPDTLMPTSSKRRSYNFTGINSYEEGVDAMDVLFIKKLSNISWNLDETREVFETDKIFLDDMDVIALAAAVARTIIFEARHALHVCYETCRMLTYKEFSTLPSYEKIFQKVKESHGQEFSYKPQIKNAKKGRKTIYAQNSIAKFDSEDTHLQLRNLTGLFRTSPYREILKNLPVYTNHIGLTLQDAEMVFTPSSEKLLS